MNLKSNNPFLSNKAFTKTTTAQDADGNHVNIIDYNNTMTVRSTMDKCLALFFLLLTSAFTTVYFLLTQDLNIYAVTISGGLSALVLSIIAGFKPQYSAIIAPVFSLLEGVFIGGISLKMEYMYPGIVLQAVGATLVTFIVCFALYRFKVVKVTEQLKSVIIAATMAVFTYYLISMGFSFLGGIKLFHHGNSLISIGFSIFVIILAALNLFLDFDFIEQGAQRRLPKYMEWFGAMGLIITLVWLYVEFLRLLSKLSSRD
ncbi:hypothetical protein CHU92_05505 [Flavobacterium cyanobacteriorum]|uniref:Bax inhibitor-1/YccA family protein n=1 Tax=Flavobacterium cyanobacteriorum TaxID=2022802 RepID=A0A255ZA69_9FLAO|nr:Bax inhibitor-1/YccA family protein [Flavobacterium cyanobacteriorum]OYQ38332.1 hypothetical protein CHU92_05505 [Flavobacterium cyanobacteriorum]